MGFLLRLVGAVVEAACRAWYEEKRRLRKAKVIGGGKELQDEVSDELERQLETGS